MHTTRIFMNGASQAVRLPAEYRFDRPEVCIARIGSMVVIYPKDEAWGLFQSAIGSVGDDFKRPAQGEHERGLTALDPTPAPVRTRAYRKKHPGKQAAKPASKQASKQASKPASTAAAKRSRKSA
jgi:antitoxin VapB